MQELDQIEANRKQAAGERAGAAGRPGAVVRLERTQADRFIWSCFGWVIGPLTWAEGLVCLWFKMGVGPLLGLMAYKRG